MIQANEPEDRGVEARLARLEERLARIERTTVPNDYIRRSFDRVYQDMTDLHYKIDSLAIEVDGVKQSNQRLEQKIDDVSTEMNGKLDLIIRRLTGMNWGYVITSGRLCQRLSVGEGGFDLDSYNFSESMLLREATPTHKPAPVNPYQRICRWGFDSIVKCPNHWHIDSGFIHAEK